MISITMLPSPFDRLPSSAQSAVQLAPGETLFRQGDPSRGPVFVRSGGIEMVRYTETGHRIVLHRAMAPDTLAEASLFSDRYHCDCLATEESSVVRLEKRAILSLLETDDAFSRQLLRRLATQIQDSRKRVEILSIRSAEERVYAALCETGQEGTVLSFAAGIGLSHEATYRALSTLVRRGLVTRRGRGRYAAI